jgi:hypothetical protein
MNNLDLSTGTISIVGKSRKGVMLTDRNVSVTDTVEVLYSTTGAASTLSVRHKAPPPAEHECYLLAPQTCTDEELDAIEDDAAIIENYILKEIIPFTTASSKSKMKRRRSSSARSKRKRYW